MKIDKKQLESIKRKMVNIIRKQQAELCEEVKRCFTDGVLFEGTLKNVYEKINELEDVKLRLWKELK